MTTGSGLYFKRSPEWWEEEIKTAPCIMLKPDGTCTGLTERCQGALHCRFFRDKMKRKKARHDGKTGLAV